MFSFVHPLNSPVTLGPFDTIWLNFEGMRCVKGGDLRAAYQKHQWSVDGVSYFRLDCTSNVAIHFESGRERSSAYGPYKRFSAVNGLAYGDDSVIAFLDYKSDRWLFYDSGYHWPVMVVGDAHTRSALS